MQNSKQIFCFTYAGGNASFFDEIEQDLPELDFVKCEYSGENLQNLNLIDGKFYNSNNKE